MAPEEGSHCIHTHTALRRAGVGNSEMCVHRKRSDLTQQVPAGDRLEKSLTPGDASTCVLCTLQSVFFKIITPTKHQKASPAIVNQFEQPFFKDYWGIL